MTSLIGAENQRLDRIRESEILAFLDIYYVAQFLSLLCLICWASSLRPRVATRSRLKALTPRHAACRSTPVIAAEINNLGI